MKLKILIALLTIASLGFYCDNSDDATAADSDSGGGGGTTTYTIGGIITLGTGAAASISGLVLQNNGGDSLTSITGAGAFNFATKTTSYSVTVSTQATSKHFCEIISGGSGTATANVTNVMITCYAKKKIFVTSVASHEGNIGFTAADALCDADSQSTEPNYDAMLVDGVTREACPSGDTDCTSQSGVNAKWIMTANTVYIRSSDSAKLFLTNGKGIYVFTGSNVMDVAFSTEVSSTSVRTGLMADWRTGTHCTNYTVTTGGANYGRADSTQTNFNSISASTTSCASPMKLYCVEQ